MPDANINTYKNILIWQQHGTVYPHRITGNSFFPIIENDYLNDMYWFFNSLDDAVFNLEAIKAFARTVRYICDYLGKKVENIIRDNKELKENERKAGNLLKTRKALEVRHSREFIKEIKIGVTRFEVYANFYANDFCDKIENCENTSDAIVIIKYYWGRKGVFRAISKYYESILKNNGSLLRMVKIGRVTKINKFFEKGDISINKDFLLVVNYGGIFRLIDDYASKDNKKSEFAELQLKYLGEHLFLFLLKNINSKDKRIRIRTADAIIQLNTFIYKYNILKRFERLFQERFSIKVENYEISSSILRLLRSGWTIGEIKNKYGSNINELSYLSHIIHYAFRNSNDQAFSVLKKILLEDTDYEYFRSFFENSIPISREVKEDLLDVGVDMNVIENYIASYDENGNRTKVSLNKNLTIQEIRSVILDELTINFFGVRKGKKLVEAPRYMNLLNFNDDILKSSNKELFVQLKNGDISKEGLRVLVTNLQESARERFKKSNSKNGSWEKVFGRFLKIINSGEFNVPNDNFFIKVWNRNPYYDLSRSDEFMCCTFLGGKNERAAIRYLFDKRVVMIDMGYGGERVWRAICFFTKNQFQPVLLIDSLEGTDKKLEKSLDIIIKSLSDFARTARITGGIFVSSKGVNDVPGRFVKKLGKSGFLEEYRTLTPIREGMEVPFVGGSEQFLEYQRKDWDTPKTRNVRGYLIPYQKS